METNPPPVRSTGWRIQVREGIPNTLGKGKAKETVDRKVSRLRYQSKEKEQLRMDTEDKEQLKRKKQGKNKGKNNAVLLPVATF